MVKFVESAVLKVVDQSSKNIRVITKAMAGFRKEANQLRKLSSMSIAPKIDTSRIRQATKDIQALNRAMGQSKGVRTNTTGINSTISALQRLQRQVAGMQGLRVNVPTNGGGGRYRGGGGMGGGPFNLNISPLQTWGAGFIYRLGHTIESSIATGFRDGVKNVDSSYTRNRLLGYTPEQIAGIDRESTRLSRENPTFARSDIRTMFAELGPMLGRDPSKAVPLVEMATQFGNLRLAMGSSPEQALEGVRSIFKMLDNINRLQDDQGNFDPKALDYFRVFMQQQAVAGGDINPQQLNTAAVYARTTGKTLSPEGFRALAMMLESMGRVAGSSLNRFVETFSGNTTKKALAAQEEWGLVDLKDVKVGKSGNVDQTEIAKAQTPAGELLRTDPNAWVVQELIPRLIERGADLNNVAQVADLLAPLSGSVVARDVANTLATWQGEYNKNLEAALQTQVSPEQLLANLDQSTFVTLQGITRQLTETLGEIGQTVLTKTIGPLQSFRDLLVNISDYLGGQDRNLGSAAVVAGGAGGVILAALGGVKALQALTGATGLNLAATNLQGSAMALNRAAVALGAGGMPDVGGTGSRTRGGARGGRRGIIPAVGAPLIAATATASILEAGKSQVESQPRHAADIARFEAWRTGVSTWLQGITEALPASNVPAGATADPNGLSKILFGSAADPNFNSKDHFAIETGRQEMLQTFNEGSQILNTGISSSAPDVASTIGNGLLGFAGPFGAAIAAALNAGFNPGPLQVTVNATAGVDAGANTNNAR